jgi:hypothetical protein
MTSLHPEKFRTDFQIVRETAEQIIRDLNIYELQITFSGNDKLAYDELKSQLLPYITALFRNDKNAFQSMLYRVDISENKFRALLKNPVPSEIEKSITDLIIEREFKKVLTKRFFSGNM